MKRLISALLLLGACTDQAIIDAAFPDRQKFAFQSKDGETVFAYTCAPDETPQATRARAGKAHRYLDGRFTAAVNGATDKLANAPDQARARSIGQALDIEIEDIVEQTEARYKCLFIQGRDA